MHNLRQRDPRAPEVLDGIAQRGPIFMPFVRRDRLSICRNLVYRYVAILEQPFFDGQQPGQFFQAAHASHFIVLLSCGSVMAGP
jgi:hypothetical protein